MPYEFRPRADCPTGAGRCGTASSTRSAPARVTVHRMLVGASNAPLIVSVVSAFFAGAALALTLRREILDRPNLYLTGDPTTRPDGNGRLVFLVENRGRQAITVGGIGLAWDVDSPPPGSDPSGQLIVNNPWDRTRLEPFGHTRVWWEPMTAPAHIDMLLRPFVEAGGRRVYGVPQAFGHLLTVVGWTPRSPLNPTHTVNLDRPLNAKPVEPKWKVWTPRHLRKPTAAPPVDISPERVVELRRRLLDT